MDAKVRLVVKTGDGETPRMLDRKFIPDQNLTIFCRYMGEATAADDAAAA